VIRFPKPKRAKSTHEAADRRGSAEVKRRSGGRCEIEIAGLRCPRPAAEVHHHIGGWKLRGRGISALAENKTHACVECHRLITGQVGVGQPLVHVAGNTYQWRDQLREIA
jgi:hypothetical protein